MKKALVFLLLLAVAGGLFAQFTIGGRVDAYWIPFQYVSTYDAGTDESLSMMGTGMARDANDGVGPRAQLLGAATNEDATMGIKIELQFRTTGTQFGFGDNVDAWWKPNDMFYLDVGKFVNNTFRGKVGDFWMRKFTVGSYNADAIFSQFSSGGRDIGGGGTVGILGLLTFGDFQVGITLPGLDQFNKSDPVLVGNGPVGGGAGQNVVHEAPDFVDGSGAFARSYEKVHVAAGYTIQDIGFARVGFVGSNATIEADLNQDGDTGDANEKGFSNFTSVIANPQDMQDIALTVVRGPRIEAAFALTAVEGLTLDFGAKYYLPLNEGSFKEWTVADAVWESVDLGTHPVLSNVGITWQNPVQLGLGAAYKVTEEFTFNGRVDFNFMGSIKIDAPNNQGGEYKKGMELNAHIWPTYNLGFMNVGLDFGIAWKADDEMVPDSGTSTEYKNGMMVGGGLFASKAWGGCTLQGGLAYSVASKIGEAGTNDVKTDGVFTIPVTFAWNF